MAPLRQLVDLLAKAVGGALARCCAPLRPGRRHTFKPTVSCYEVPDLRELPPDSKRQLWWSPEDFESFLRAHVQIAEAYSQAVERGEAELFRSDPVLANDSRRGLGLGRGPMRASNSQAYFTAVMDEQDRQRDLGVTDREAMSRVAAEASLVEVRYSIENAARDAEDTQKYMAEATCLPEDQEAEAAEVAPAEATWPPRAPERTVAPGSPWLDEAEADAAIGDHRSSEDEDEFCDSFGEQPFPALMCPQKAASDGGGALRPLTPQQSPATKFKSWSYPSPNLPKQTAATILSGMEKAESFPTFPDSEADNGSRREDARGFGLTSRRLQEAGFLPSGRQSAGPGSPQPRRLSPRTDERPHAALARRSPTM